jgi:sirohydrochlorin cobaltochelatase
LLFAAGHAKRDIPAAAAAAFAAGGMAAVQAAPLGCEAALVELSHRRVQKAVTGRLHVPAEETCLLLVGRGSSDESATAQMREFARLRQRLTGGMHVEVAFLAMAQPRVREQLPRIAAAGFRRVIVQPHLLFQGDLATSLEEEVAKISARNSQTEWLLTPLLADLAGEEGIGSDILAEVVCKRFREARFRVAAPAGEH